MRSPHRPLGWLRGCFTAIPIGVTLLAAAIVRPAEPIVSDFHPCAAASAPMGLEECLALALQKQPLLAVRRASLAAAEDAQRALDSLHFPATLVHELPIRQHQAELGVTAAAAGLDQTEHDTIYAVTRTYYTVVYAREQERVARSVVERLKTTNGLAARMLKEGARDVAATDVDRSSVYLDLAETKRIQASEGVKRALAALREAIGLGPHCDLQVPDEHLPEPDGHPCLEQVVTLALARRGDLIQANIFAEVVALEIDAQKTSQRQRMETFAIGADIHADPVPTGEHNGEYRPGTVPPAMPTTLVGCPSERVARACSFSQRAAAAAEKARNLIVLEAEDAFYRWEEASQKAERAKRAATNGDKLAGNLGQDFAGGLRVKVEDVINAHVLTSQARSQYNQFVYEEILALADLERISAGGFCAGLVAPASKAPSPERKPEPKAAPKDPLSDPF